MERVPFVNLGPDTRPIKAELLKAAEKILDSGFYIMGPELTAFESEFAKLCGTQFAVGMDNGTHALIIALREIGLKPGDEVITTSNSFIASASSTALLGGKPVFCDISRDLNMDPAKLEECITPETKAIMPVHLTGRPAKMGEINRIAKKHGLFVLEDAAQAAGAKLNGQPVGSLGDAACFSLHPLKNLHAFGDGGALTTDDKEFHQRILQARNHGLINRNECTFWSYNSRLDEMQAAFLRVQMRGFEKMTETRRSLAKKYNEAIANCVEVPLEGPGEYHVYQTYMVQADKRDELMEHLNKNGVEARVHYPIPIHMQPAARELGYAEKDLPETMRASRRILSLPLYPSMTSGQQETVITLIKKFYGK